MVKVYHFRVYDFMKDDWHIPPAKSPAGRIEQVGGEIIKNTEQEVSDADLDPQGRYWPNGIPA